MIYPGVSPGHWVLHVEIAGSQPRWAAYNSCQQQGVHCLLGAASPLLV